MYITILVEQVYWYISQVSGERLQDHWSSGLRDTVIFVFFYFWDMGYSGILGYGILEFILGYEFWTVYFGIWYIAYPPNQASKMAVATRCLLTVVHHTIISEKKHYQRQGFRL